MLGCGQGDKHKKMYWFFGWISDEVCKISDVETYNAQIEKASNKIDSQKQNDQLSSLRPEKSSPGLIHQKKILSTKFLHSNKYMALDR
jgi:hypothetical protein